MEDKSDATEIKPNPIVRPNWKVWKKKSAWRLSEAVALTLNISPKFLEKTRKSHPKKYNTYLVRLEVVEGQKPGTFEFFDEHRGNGQTHNSMMVSAQSFISFAMSEKGWKNLPAGLLEIVQENDIQTADLSTKVARKANIKFIPALIKLLVEIGNREGKRGNSFDVYAMPGVRKDFQSLASEYDSDNLGGFTYSSFNTYIKGLCGFKSGAKTSVYYLELFPTLVPKRLAENKLLLKPTT